VQAIGEEGSTALHEAITRGRQREALLLLSAGANPFCENARGAPPLRRVEQGPYPTLLVAAQRAAPELACRAVRSPAPASIGAPPPPFRTLP